MTVNISWENWWNMYIHQPQEQKEQTWKCNFGMDDSWKEFVQSKASNIQVEILKDAPEEIKVVLESVLLPDAKEKLLSFMHPKTKASNRWEKYHPK